MAAEILDSLDKLDKSQLKSLIVDLLARIELLVAQNQVLVARVAELEARLGAPPKTPTNSSLPPSKGQKANRQDRPGGKKRRKGRPGVARALSPHPDHTREIYADACAGCGAALSAADQPDGHACDHVELPPIKPANDCAASP